MFVPFVERPGSLPRKSSKATVKKQSIMEREKIKTKSSVVNSHGIDEEVPRHTLYNLSYLWSYLDFVNSFEIHDIEPFPFAATPSSNITKARLAQQLVAFKSARSRYGPKDPRPYDALLQEAALWSSLDNVNIQPILGLYISSPRFSPALVSPFREEGNLLDYLKKCPTLDKWAMLEGIANGLVYLHSLEYPILHGDIRAMNILVGDTGNPLLNDFGSALVLDKTGTMLDSAVAIRGTCRWMAPEVLSYECDSDPSPITLAADVYSFGMTFIELFSEGKRPFDHLATDGAVIVEVLINKKKHPRPSGPHAASLTDELWMLIGRCLSHNPLGRPSMEEVSLFFRSSPSLAMSL